MPIQSASHIGGSGHLAQRERVMVTGIGLVTPCGTGRENFWAGLLSDPENRPIREVKDFSPAAYMTPQAIRRAERVSQLALVAAYMAMEEAGLGYEDAPNRSGVVLGTAGGAYALVEERSALLRIEGERAVPPTFLARIMPNAPVATIAIATNRQGPCMDIATGCASGTNAIAQGTELIRSGRCDIVLAGGAEAFLSSPVLVGGFKRSGAMSENGVCLPFDRRRNGFVLAEGAAVLVLESESHARARGARCQAEVLGWAATCDAHSLMIPDPAGTAAAECMRLAIDDAGLEPADIRHLNAHGTGTTASDIAEAKAIIKVFGDSGELPLVTSVKAVTGHAIGGAGAIEAASTIIAMEKRTLPPTAGFSEPDPDCPVPVVQAPTSWDPGPVVSNSFAFGGHNCSVVIGPSENDDHARG